ncbi:hypothetical protein [Candidatus Vallotia lariciata]|uniref:hypothetical protein n=1 Tax=Candidatus Vallotia laricis TaxID=2018052 RepID=UPI001D00F012|nr:hypothetical protein [Candidatus Vallotia lariciata]UDG82680.1 hypothetical protein GKR41_p00035 [Candidatus Vallotia lariciata]
MKISLLARRVAEYDAIYSIDKLMLCLSVGIRSAIATQFYPPPPKRGEGDKLGIDLRTTLVYRRYSLVSAPALL